MERLLHYIWKYKLYSPFNLHSTDGDEIQIIDPGIHNSDAGPDFFNAKIKIRNEFWAGNVEIHTNSSDWFQHKHHTDKAYENVILHVVESENTRISRSNGELIPQLILNVSEELKNNMNKLLQNEQRLSCLPYIHSIPSPYLAGWLEALATERLQRKTNDILHNLELKDNDWNEVCYISICRSLGVGINNDAFERMAKSLPLRCIQRHRSNIIQVEALFFGQAGVLELDEKDPYFLQLRQEYQFLKQKFNLAPPDSILLRSLRIRPTNFPYLKLAQMAAIWAHYPTLFSEILNKKTPQAAMELFTVPVSKYWQTHYHFQYASSPRENVLGTMALQILLINTVIPLIMAYSIKNKDSQLAEKAFQWLTSLPPERNSIIAVFSQAGIKVHNAADTQALIQLKREYCEKKKCLYCRIGYQLLKQKCKYPL